MQSAVAQAMTMPLARNELSDRAAALAMGLNPDNAHDMIDGGRCGSWKPKKKVRDSSVRVVVP